MEFTVYFNFGIIPGDEARSLSYLLPVELVQRDNFDEYRLKKQEIKGHMTLEELVSLSSEFPLKIHGLNIQVNLD